MNDHIRSLTFIPILVLTMSLPAGEAQARRKNAVVRSPVAVMPFKNLQEDKRLDWLRAGAAETILADLKRSKAVEIVERAQIGRAMAELQLQGETDLYAPEKAAQIGRMVGAKTIVVGAIQRAGKKLRLTARFVDVETGVVKGSAKATGAQRRVFALQDRIVDQLLGRRARARLKARPRRKETQAEADGYKRYALSLTARDPKAQRAFLKEALDFDPKNVYAKFDLEARLSTATQAARGKQRAGDAAALALILDVKQPPRARTDGARDFLDELLTNRRYFTAQDVAIQIAKAGLPNEGAYDPSEHAAYALTLTRARLRTLEAAVQTGEAYMTAYPRGAHFAEVEAIVRGTAEEIRSLDERKASYREDLQSALDDAAALKKARVARKDLRWAEVDWGECIAAKWARLPDEVFINCDDFLTRWRARAGELEDGRSQVQDAWSWTVWAEAQRARFVRADEAAKRLRERHPKALADAQVSDGHKNHSVERYWMQRWPTDAR